MDFDFTDDQEQLRAAVRRWVDKAYGFERRRAISRAGGFSPEAYRELAQLGLCGLYVNERHDGLGLGPVEGMVVMEELGRGLVHEPLAQTLISSVVLGAWGEQQLQGRWLPDLAQGRAMISLAHQERAARYRTDLCAAVATASGAGWAVSGIKNLVPIGDHVEACIVPALADGQIALFLVETRNKPGVHMRPYATQDGGRAADLLMTNAAASLITRDGQVALEHGIDIGIAALCAEGVGAMEKTLAITVDYMNTRKQFGVVIASFQALRHRVADMKMQLELARSMSYYAALKLDAPPAERRRALARAKCQLGQSMRFVGQSAVQLHGGIGVTDEYIISHYFKKLTQLELTFGDTLHQLGEVSRLMQDTAGVFT